ncbi:hypothetical protein LV779_28170 [Streptomyces thinghirensis]|nr:hypothetical protein [Streptomyces thinghirensis]
MPRDQHPRDRPQHTRPDPARRHPDPRPLPPRHPRRPALVPPDPPGRRVRRRGLRQPRPAGRPTRLRGSILDALRGARRQRPGLSSPPPAPTCSR